MICSVVKSNSIEAPHAPQEAAQGLHGLQAAQGLHGEQAAAQGLHASHAAAQQPAFMPLDAASNQA
jgi:hypothetical protein